MVRGVSVCMCVGVEWRGWLIHTFCLCGAGCVDLSSVLPFMSLQRNIIPFPQGQLPTKEEQAGR